jgi:hypothetical protein
MPTYIRDVVIPQDYSIPDPGCPHCTLQRNLGESQAWHHCRHRCRLHTVALPFLGQPPQLTLSRGSSPPIPSPPNVIHSTRAPCQGQPRSVFLPHSLRCCCPQVQHKLPAPALLTPPPPRHCIHFSHSHDFLTSKKFNFSS